MPNKNVYVSLKNLETWEKAEKIARDDDRSLSSIIVRLLREYVRYNSKTAKGTKP